MKGLGFGDHSKEDIDKMVSNMDTDQNGLIEYPEFEKIMKSKMVTSSLFQIQSRKKLRLLGITNCGPKSVGMRIVGNGDRGDWGAHAALPRPLLFAILERERGM